MTAIDGEEVSSAGQIARPGHTLTVTLFRDGRYEDVAMLLGPMHRP